MLQIKGQKLRYIVRVYRKKEKLTAISSYKRIYVNFSGYILNFDFWCKPWTMMEFSYITYICSRHRSTTTQRSFVFPGRHVRMWLISFDNFCLFSHPLSIDFFPSNRPPLGRLHSLRRRWRSPVSGRVLTPRSCPRSTASSPRHKMQPWKKFRKQVTNKIPTYYSFLCSFKRAEWTNTTKPSFRPGIQPAQTTVDLFYKTNIMYYSIINFYLCKE